MSEDNIESMEVESAGPPQNHQVGIMSPDVGMLVLTWVTFFFLLAILYKFAWKPILSALDAREDTIRRSLDDARKAKEELARIDEQRHKIITAADHQAKDIVDRSKKAAVEAAKAIERKAKDEVSILMGNAESEIEAMQKNARMTLRRESVDLAIGLAEKLIKENLDVKKQQKLTDHLLQEFKPEEHEKS